MQKIAAAEREKNGFWGAKNVVINLSHSSLLPLSASLKSEAPNLRKHFD